MVRSLVPRVTQVMVGARDQVVVSHFGDLANEVDVRHSLNQVRFRDRASAWLLVFIWGQGGASNGVDVPFVRRLINGKEGKMRPLPSQASHGAGCNISSRRSDNVNYLGRVFSHPRIRSVEVTVTPSVVERCKFVPLVSVVACHLTSRVVQGAGRLRAMLVRYRLSVPVVFQVYLPGVRVE